LRRTRKDGDVKKEERGRKGILYAHRENIIESAAGAPGLAITLSNCFCVKKARWYDIKE